MVGSLPIFGLRTSEVMGPDDTVVHVTSRFRNQGWAATSDWAVISDDGRGNPIGMADDGAIYLSDHEAQLVAVASSFEDFLNRVLDERLFER